jgi:diguanylate cyclase (GGDEF)-like protein
MSLIRQVWLLLLGTVFLAFAGSVTVSTTASRDLVQTQLSVKNTDNAASLAIALSQQKGDVELMSLLMTAQFDAGAYRSVKLTAADGSVVFSREAAGGASSAPAWFVAAVPITVSPGVAQVSDGWKALGQVRVESQTFYAHDALWASSERSALAMALVGLLAAGVGILIVRRITRPLHAVVEQARALEQGTYLTVAESGEPELRRLSRTMNELVERLRSSATAQAQQLLSLHRRATADPLTGIANRQHVLGQIESALQRDDGPEEMGLLLLRVMDLAGLNRLLGHATADRLLLTVAQTLQPYGDQVRGCLLGRLNGSDFVLCLPASGVAFETAQAIVDALRVVLPTYASSAAVCMGTVEFRRDTSPGDAISRADAALARAESRGAFAVAADGDAQVAIAVLGEGAWRQRVQASLAQHRVRIMEFPLLNARRQLLHLECALRLQLEPDGEFVTAAHWLPLAVRSRLTVDADERALALAITAAEHDGQARCVNLSPASLTDSGFAGRLRALLWKSPRVARLIWLEIAETAAFEQFDLVQELGRQLRSTGVHFGLEHAGERIGQMPRLFEAGLDYVKLDASIVAGVSRDEERALLVRSTVTLLHGMAMQVYAEGVGDGDDAARLWECGLDGATGPWISTLELRPGA